MTIYCKLEDSQKKSMALDVAAGNGERRWQSILHSPFYTVQETGRKEMHIRQKIKSNSKKEYYVKEETPICQPGVANFFLQNFFS